LNDWFNVLKRGGSRKPRMPRTSTTRYGEGQAELGNPRRKLIPKWVTGSSLDTIGGVRVQYNTLQDVILKNLKHDRMILASWYIRSYVTKIFIEIEKRKGRARSIGRAREPYNPFSGKPRTAHDTGGMSGHYLTPIKSITGRTLTWLYWQPKNPIQFMRLYANQKHESIQEGTQIMDLGNGEPEKDWENNEFAKLHIKQRFGDAEVPEAETEEEETEGATIGDTLDEETRRRIAGGVDNAEE